MDNSTRQWLGRIKEFRRERNWEHDDVLPIVFLSTVNGYHHFRYLPPEGDRMTMLTETNNRFDENAVLVMHGGRKVGRVPQGLCDIISDSIKRHKLRRASVFYTGQMQHDGPVVGGGPKLVSVYLLEFNRATDLPQISRRICQYVNEDKMFL